MLNKKLIDLLMLEIYIKPGESLEQLKAALDSRKQAEFPEFYKTLTLYVGKTGNMIWKLNCYT